MDNYKLATRGKFRFNTPKGILSVEQLWDLSLEDLNYLAVSLDDEYLSSGKKSFLVKTTTKNKTAKLKFDIVLDVLNTKKDEAEAAQTAREDKAHNDKIYGLIAEKQDETLKSKSVKELEKQLR